MRYNTSMYEFYYKNYEIENNKIIYHYEIPNLTKFQHKIEFESSLDIVPEMAFYLGMVEMISYWKAVCCPKIHIECGKLSSWQKSWFQKLYRNGLGEFFYVNKMEEVVPEFIVENSEEKIKLPNKNLHGCFIPIGGGKDSCVTLELIQKEAKNFPITVNPKEINLKCAETAGYDNIIKIKRIIDNGLIELNKKGFLNGHTPFSASFAFLSFLSAYSSGVKYIAMSNESSANEANEKNGANHQYSKSYEFEKDFQEFIEVSFAGSKPFYFSLLRPLNELQIAMLFANNEKYHKIFKSCNIGSKNAVWQWCCNCPKCLFVYIIMQSFLPEDKMIKIFGENLLEKCKINEKMKQYLLELQGEGDKKPFECVGTFEEVNWALSHKFGEYNPNEEEILNRFNKENSVPEEFIQLFDTFPQHHLS